MATSSPTNTTQEADVAWQLVEKLDEQRNYPHFKLDIRVAFRNSNGQRCAARLLNIAPGSSSASFIGLPFFATRKTSQRPD
jgi:hypothetical protein